MILQHSGYLIKPYAPAPSSYVIVTEGQGGKIPKVMEGVFTSRSLAKEVIDYYVSNRETKEPVNDKKIVKRGV